MPKTALITGATSGLGAAFSRQLASEGYGLVIHGRNDERLQANADEIRKAHGVDVEVIVADLSGAEGVEKVAQRLGSQDAPIDFFVNNAGFGLDGGFIDVPIEEHERLVRVNVTAVLHLTHTALGVMQKRNTGDIINLSSVAAFTPGVRKSSTYAATKAFVLALSEGLEPSLAGTGVRLSALCPGFVQTEFHTRADIDTKKISSFMWLQPDDVVRIGLRDHRKGHPVVITGAVYKFVVLSCRVLPHSIIRKASTFTGRTSRKH